MTMDGTLRVVISPIARPREGGLTGAQLLHIRVRHDKLDAVARSLATRDDIPFVDLTTSGDEVVAIAATRPGSRDPLVFRLLPSTPAVTSVETATVLHVLRVTSEWRHQVLDPEEISALAQGDPHTGTAATDGPYGVETDVPERARLKLRVSPDHLDRTGRVLAEHPAVHGDAFATSGPSNLSLHVWLPGPAALYDFLSRDVTGLDIASVETTIISHWAKRPW